ncbi:hypothetical protein HYFRA_00006096 [Hymenoscyphus fraxineus]|uniref:F-box domain-containing protein n=1 Tax=Hymenoscyphus fraxineus TaxID=746836 RepID=A0A9N9LCA0_9HELO|nr:hypothetical protein HYFRA_00006096 [Hymenoscyphus fraxineus]
MEGTIASPAKGTTNQMIGEVSQSSNDHHTMQITTEIDKSALQVIQNTDKPTLHALPEELLIQIMEWLDIDNSVCLGLTARKFYRIHWAIYGKIRISTHFILGEPTGLHEVLENWLKGRGFTLVVWASDKYEYDRYHPETLQLVKQSHHADYIKSIEVEDWVLHDKEHDKKFMVDITETPSMLWYYGDYEVGDRCFASVRYIKQVGKFYKRTYDDDFHEVEEGKGATEFFSQGRHGSVTTPFVHRVQSYESMIRTYGKLSVGKNGLIR